MKDFIKNRVRMMLEGRDSLDTSTNVHHRDGNEPLGFVGTVEDMRGEIAKATKVYNGDIRSFSPMAGEGMYEYVLRRLSGDKFSLVGKQNSLGHKRLHGDTNKDKNGNSYYYINANNRVPSELMINYKVEKFGKPEEYVYATPADYGFIKLLAEKGAEIIDTMSSQTYVDGNNVERSQELSLDKAKYKFDKWDREQEKLKNKPGLQMGGDKKDIYNRMMDVRSAKVSAMRDRDREEVKRLSALEKELNDIYKSL